MFFGTVSLLVFAHGWNDVCSGYLSSCCYTEIIEKTKS